MAARTAVNPSDRVATSAPAVRLEGRLDDMLIVLRRREDALRAMNVRHLWIFGSVARGEDHAGSDVDIVVEMEPGARVSLTAFAHLQLDLSDMLERPVDLATWETLREHVVEAARRDAVSVF